MMRTTSIFGQLFRINVQLNRLFRIRLIRARPRFKINKHNPLPPPETYRYVQLAPGWVSEAMEAYEQWEGKESLPYKLKELFMVLRLEVDRRYK